MAGATRLELATSGLTGRRSNQTELRPRQICSDKASNIVRADTGVKYLVVPKPVVFLTDLFMGKIKPDMIQDGPSKSQLMS